MEKLRQVEEKKKRKKRKRKAKLHAKEYLEEVEQEQSEYRNNLDFLTKLTISLS